jgi:hypothetical protein
VGRLLGPRGGLRDRLVELATLEDARHLAWGDVACRLTLLRLSPEKGQKKKNAGSLSGV